MSVTSPTAPRGTISASAASGTVSGASSTGGQSASPQRLSGKNTGKKREESSGEGFTDAASLPESTAIPKSTPMIQQYLDIKLQYPDALLFYRMGDFYEMFFEDAKVASRVLDITLTSRNKKDEAPVPMCGVPYRAVQGYVARLIGEGFKVAICDQTEDPSQTKGLVKREVVRVITPGMIVDTEFLDAKANNFVVALAEERGIWGLSCLDVSTAAFRVTESAEPAKIVEELRRIGPSEVLAPVSWKEEKRFAAIRSAMADRAVSWIEDRWFEFEDARRRLAEQFQTLSLEGFGCERLQAGVGAAGALLYYVRETQKQRVSHLGGIETYLLDAYLWVDEVSRRNLELEKNIASGSRKGTLLDVLDRTVTAMGGRLLRQWLMYPLLVVKDIEARLDAVGQAGTRIRETDEIRDTLKTVADLERIGSRVALGRANARDMTALKKSLFRLPDVVERCAEFGSPSFRFQGDLQPLLTLAELIDRAIREDAPPTLAEGGIIRKGYHPELDDLIEISRDGKGWLARLEGREKEATGIGSLKVRYNRVFGYYIEIPRAHSEKAPAHYTRKQTLVNAERYVTDELKEFENRVLGAEDRRTALELELFNGVRDEARRHNFLIQKAARFVARIDCLLSLAVVAEANNYTRPELNAEGSILIEGGRHPVIEKMIAGERFVPNGLRLDNQDNQVLIITGPNMAGKSTVLRQAAILVIMAQMGSWVPADFASVAVTDRIFTRVGALDNLSQGQSTFMVEMQETANILNNATPNSLVILDEIGRGTSTFDGLSIAWAVAEFLHDLKGAGVKTLFATHYHELIGLAATKRRVRNFHIAVKEDGDDIVFLRRLTEGGTDRSYGIHVARLAGIPQAVIERARVVLDTVEKEHRELPRDMLRLSERRTAFQSRQAVQMRLFPSMTEEIVQRIQGLDISRTTPLEALNILNELQEKAKYQ